MRFRFLAAATAMLAFTLAAHADSLTQNFSEVFGLAAGAYPTYTLQITKFDPTLGTLTSISGTLSGNVDARGVLYVNTVNNITLDQYTSSSAGLHPFSVSGSLTNSSVLAAETGTGLGTYTFNIGNNSAMTGNVNGTITYNYTPLTTTAPTPEPSSLALLGTGILGVIGAARRRFAA